MSLFSNVSNALSKTNIKVQRVAPDIGVYVGVGGLVLGSVLAFFAAKKVEPILDTHKAKMDEIEANKGLVEDDGTPVYDEAELNREKHKVVMETGAELVKTFAPVAIVEAASVMCVLGGFRGLKKRNIALAALYGALDRKFKQYRKRVQEELGDEIENHFRYGIEEKEVELVEVDDAGKEKKKKVKGVQISTDHEVYGRWFDRTCKPRWENNRAYNLTFLQQAQETFTNILKGRGHVFLNEVYDHLGMPRTPEGQVVGWCLDCPDSDDFVSFGIFANSPLDVKERNGYLVVRQVADDIVTRGADIFCDFNVVSILDYI